MLHILIHSGHSTTKISPGFSYSTINYGVAKLTSTNCMKTKQYQYQIKGDTYDPNKWRGVTLMNIDNKIYSSIMCERLFKIISKYGVKCQFGSTPGVGHQDGTFAVKTLLHLIQNHKLPTWVVFADLVKAFGTSNHSLLGCYLPFQSSFYLGQKGTGISGIKVIDRNSCYFDRNYPQKEM